MWGGTKGATPRISALFDEFAHDQDNGYHQDTRFLEKLYEQVDAKVSVLSHDAWTCEKWGGLPYPLKRRNLKIVGMKWKGDTQGHYSDPEDELTASGSKSDTPHEVPMKCRRQPENIKGRRLLATT
mmetsp:Transcript_18627/g.44669  ORF Transcript_18627/g.44669 Transcript_18627/m.44669 type:complete len:126 (+) Transcript_18627:418-795(+)